MRLLTRDEIRSRSPRTGWWLGAVAGLFFSVLFLFVWQKIQLSDQLMRIERKERTLAAVRSQQKALSVEIQRLGYPGRLEAVAAAELGMKYPDKEQMVVMISPPAAAGREGVFAALFQPVKAAWSQP
jgi:cell division protein FtsL